MVSFLLFIKYKLSKLWSLLEIINGLLFKILYKPVFDKNCNKYLRVYSTESICYRKLDYQDLANLHILLTKLEKDKVRFFEAHNYDIQSLEIIFKNPSFIMMGAFKNNMMVGYFFLRCFINKKCFVGRLVEFNSRGFGIGKKMNEILYHTSWDCGFRCYATISTENELVINSHKKNKYIINRKKLQDNYLLVEFVKK